METSNVVIIILLGVVVFLLGSKVYRDTCQKRRELCIHRDNQDTSHVVVPVDPVVTPVVPVVTPVVPPIPTTTAVQVHHIHSDSTPRMCELCFRRQGRYTAHPNESWYGIFCDLCLHLERTERNHPDDCKCDTCHKHDHKPRRGHNHNGHEGRESHGPHCRCNLCH